MILPVLLAALPSILPEPLLHVRADTGVVLDANGRVARWKDLSSRHADFGTSTLGKPNLLYLTKWHDTATKRSSVSLASDSLLRPRLVRDAMGGRPAIVFDGAQALVDTSTLPLDSGFTFFAVARNQTDSGRIGILFDKGLGDLNCAFPNGWDDNVIGHFDLSVAWIANVAGSDFQTSAPALYQSDFDGSSGNLRANSQFLSSGTWGGGSIQRHKTTWIGAVTNPYGDLQNFLTGAISEIIIYPGVLDSTARHQVEAELMARYEIDASEPPVVDDGILLHVRADTGVVLDANGKVMLWKDLSSRHADFGTSTLGKPSLLYITKWHDTAAKRNSVSLASDSLLRPRLVRDAMGGRPAVVFDGAQALVDTSTLPLDSGFTFFAVAKNLTDSGRGAVLIDKGPGDLNCDFPNGWDDDIVGHFNISIAWTANAAKSDFQTTAPALYESDFDKANANLRVNGEFLSTGSLAGLSIQRHKSTWIGSVANPYGQLQNFFTGAISEILIYRGVLDSARRARIEAELMARYEIHSTPIPVVDPPAIGSRLLLHVRADSGVILDDNGKVKLWKDRSPRHADFGTPTLGTPNLLYITKWHDTASKHTAVKLASDSLLRPRLVRNAMGGYPAIVFDGAQALVDTSTLPLDSGFSFFAVAKNLTDSGRGAVLIDKGPGDLNCDFPNGWDDDIVGHFNISIAWTSTAAKSDFQSNNPVLYEADFDRTDANLRVNGEFLSTGSLAGLGIQRHKSTWIGSVTNPYGQLQNFLTGAISEILIYRGVLDSARRIQVEAELMGRYAIGAGGRTLGIGSPARPRHQVDVRIIQDRIEVRAEEGATLEIRSLDGRRLGLGSIRSGVASLPRVHGSAFLAAHHPDGTTTTRMLIDPAR